MKRCLLPFMLILLLMAAGCSRASDQYKITVASGEEYIDRCPKSAKAGETVHLQVLFVTDADMHISINGDEEYGSFAENESYEFIMPEEDVRIDVWVVSNGLADTEQDNKNTKGFEAKASGGRWPPSEPGESNNEITGKGSLPKDSPDTTEKTEATTAKKKNSTSATTAKKKNSTSATTAVDPFDHDIEAYYEDNKDIYDSFDDAWDGFEDDEDAWDDY